MQKNILQYSTESMILVQSVGYTHQCGMGEFCARSRAVKD